MDVQGSAISADAGADPIALPSAGAAVGAGETADVLLDAPAVLVGVLAAYRRALLGVLAGAAGGKTSPEELLAAAHASCFSMALSGALAKAGTPPESLEVRARVTFDKRGAGWAITTSELEVKGVVPGADAAAFQEAAEGAKEGCPVSQALSGNVKMSVSASLVDPPVGA